MGFWTSVPSTSWCTFRGNAVWDFSGFSACVVVSSVGIDAVRGGKFVCGRSSDRQPKLALLFGLAVKKTPKHRSWNNPLYKRVQWKSWCADKTVGGFEDRPCTLKLLIVIFFSPLASGTGCQHFVFHCLGWGFSGACGPWSASLKVLHNLVLECTFCTSPCYGVLSLSVFIGGCWRWEARWAREKITMN